MRISYFYDMALPTRYAAAIQILNTCRELANLNVRVAVYVTRFERDPLECLAVYGLEPHPLFSIEPLFGGLHYRIRPNACLRGVLRKSSSQGPHWVVSRGEPGILLYQRLRQIGLQPNERWIYEAHRPCAGHPVESGIPDEQGHLNMALDEVRRLEEAAVERAAGLVCLTPAVQQALGARFRLPKNVLILPSGTSVPSEDPPDDSGRDIPIFYAGKLQRRKGVLDLVHAMRYLPEFRVWIAGGSEKEVSELRREAEASGVSSRVEVRGFVDPGRMQSLYWRARVGVCPLPSGEGAVSERFTSPLKVLNMMASGVPVVATDLPSVRRILTHEATGLLVEPGNTEALAAAVRRLLVDRPLAHRLAAAARVAAEQYSWQNRARRLRDFLFSIG
jgi:glycosyltransferase involved in cell wall biosynthesis